MSGIVGIFERGGRPVQRTLLRGLTHFLSFRGPDAREVWADGPAGFGHTLLRSTKESLAERQPASLEGRYTIAADARVDCREELLSDLSSAGCKAPKTASDAELILQAYAAWGEECVGRLRGDFAFAIWDSRNQTLFCARDHFGVKPFYYAEAGETFVFSNTLDCLRLHPGVSEDLNDAAIADFLLFGLNCDESTTTYGQIRRLPPAHTLRVRAGGLQARRYWAVPADGRIRYRRSQDYVEHFQTVMHAAVADRLRVPRAGIWLSGGMDSSSIAAIARELAERSGGADLRAYTVVYDPLIPDREGEHARSVAEFLKIPIRCLETDGHGILDRWEHPESVFPEPVEDPFAGALFDHYGSVAADCRVMLSGHGGDELMYFQMLPYARDLIRNRRWRQLSMDVARFLRLRRFPSRGIQQRIARALGGDAGTPRFPSWLAADLVKRLRLEERWREQSRSMPVSQHPVVPRAHASLCAPRWSRLFEMADPGVTRVPVEVRYPFLDLRVVNYVLAIPPFPWTFQKRLLRAAMTGRLPENIRQRPKTPLGDDPLMRMIARSEGIPAGFARWSKQIEHYANPQALPSLNENQNSMRLDQAVRVHCLNFWLQSLTRVRYNNYAEAGNG